MVSLYDSISIKGTKVRVQRNGKGLSSVYVTLAINNNSRHLFRGGRLVVKQAPHKEVQTSVWVWPFGPTEKEIQILRNAEVPWTVKNLELQVLFYDPAKERGLSVGGKIFDVDFSNAEVEYFG
ncbi:MAG: hypothetical protein QGG54_02065 [Gammaproteobacteria bacterium]|jgi:hypothetical protein|nr:hypothetical protein [Gammaproteobacteria bacterium]MDP6652845.1 hypothetical protein [Gammaproteobacteria bacterium]|tara:strand:+ start:2419 stop:2787 length:369 start_codon:yes stop_codon:yes gene_type:complete